MALNSTFKCSYRNHTAKFVSLKSIRNLRSWFREAASEDVQDVIEQLELIKREKTKEEEERALYIGYQDELNKQYAILSGQLQFKGAYEPQDIMDALMERLSCKARRYRAVRIKYRYTDLQGNTCEWSGQGREPLTLREVLEVTGKNREDFLVNADDNIDDVDIIINEESTDERLSRSIDFKQDAIILNNIEYKEKSIA